jgi:AraC family transcriptional regulator, regulatory protein of adaptative response / DNA-3-methyladenine glycosylase II
LRLIADGVADEMGVTGLTRRLGMSERHLQRVFRSEIGATPGVITRSRRAHLARQLLMETAMPITLVAFAAGFGSVRAFNDTIRQIYRVMPTELRRRRGSVNGALSLQLPYRPPLAAATLLDFLRARAIPGVEDVTETSYRRSTSFGRGGAVVELRPTAETVTLTVEADDVAPLTPIVQRARRLFDLDAVPAAIDEWLDRSMVLRPLLAESPGVRLAGTFDAFESGVQAILEQGASTSAAASLAGRIATAFGSPLPQAVGSITHQFPTPAQLVEADLDRIGLSPRRRRTVVAFATAVQAGTVAIDGSIDPEAATTTQLLAVSAIGARTAAIVAMRGVRDPDAFPVTDAVIRRSISALPGGSARPLSEISRAWRPWRGYAAMHLWAYGTASRGNGAHPESIGRPRRA